MSKLPFLAVFYYENRPGTLYFFVAVEFPAVLLDLLTGKIVDEFQQYVLPRDNPKLSDFCKTLTGISQVNDCLSH